MSEAAQKDDFVLPFGKAKIERPGKDVTIVTLSRCVGQALTAAEQLKKDYGVEAEVINLRSIKPMDVEAIVKSVKKTGHIIALESGFPSFGVGAEILALTMEYAQYLYVSEMIWTNIVLDMPLTTSTRQAYGSQGPRFLRHTLKDWKI